MTRHRYDAVLFDLDGVLTPTTALHVDCWKRALDSVLTEWAERTGRPQELFDAEREYVALLDGKPRNDGVRDFLRARGIDAPEGHSGSLADEWSVHGIGNRKQRLVEQALARGGIEAFPGSVSWVKQLRAAGMRTAVVSSSTNTDQVLRAAGIGHLFEVVVDGRDIERLGLDGKPRPDGFLEAASRLRVPPARAVVVEDALAGVAAGRAGRFGLVIGVARQASRQDLWQAGASTVVSDLGELVA
jgi:beta-phosphoglucomutase family hydrolase